MGFSARADGYRILIGGETKIVWAAPFKSLADVKAGDRIEYKGKRNAAGAVIAASVKLGPDAISSGEEKLRKKQEYDPSTVPANAQQNLLTPPLLGYNPKKFPPSKDTAMQARIEKIGKSLIPAYQRELPDSDPAKVHFRFQLVDSNLLRDVLALSSGIILLPHQVVARMQNDSQLAAVLAKGIAFSLENEAMRMRGVVPGVAVASFLIFNPLIAYGITAKVKSEVQLKLDQQSDRVSLGLLHDAGYDIDQAPMAWWLLASKQPKPVTQIKMPERAAYLYRMLGETWHNPAAAAQQAH